MRVSAGSVTWIGTIATHCWTQPPFDSGTTTLLLGPAPLPSRSTVHYQFGATSRCSSAAEAVSRCQTMTYSSPDHDHQVSGANCAGYSRQNSPRCWEESARADARRWARLTQARCSNGVWRSLVARFVRDEEVAGSNPVTPTNRVPGQRHTQILDRSLRAASTAAKYSSTSVQDVSKSPQRITCSGRARVGVDLHRDRLVGMPQDSHDHARMHIEVNEQRGGSVPGAMNGQPTHSRGLAARRELPVESARIYRSAITPVKTSDGMSFVCCQISPAASRSPSCCVRLIISAATMFGMGSQAIRCFGFRF